MREQCYWALTCSDIVARGTNRPYSSSETPLLESLGQLSVDRQVMVIVHLLTPTRSFVPRHGRDKRRGLTFLRQERWRSIPEDPQYTSGSKHTQLREDREIRDAQRSTKADELARERHLNLRRNRFPAIRQDEMDSIFYDVDVQHDLGGSSADW